MLVLVAPGQGAQAPGFLTPWLDLPGAADRLAAWSDAIGLDLVRYGTQAGADDIRDTAVAQPLLVAAGLLAAEALGDVLALGTGRTGSAGSIGTPGRATTACTARASGAPLARRVAPGAIAGHSVGEITAAVLCGVLEETAALRWVRERGLAMAEAAAVTETGMAALLGGEPDVVLPALRKLGLTAANVNGAGQLVVAGTTEELAALRADPPEGVRKVVPLKVAGAFHTHHMAPAVQRLRHAAERLAPADPTLRYVSNKDGAQVRTGAAVVERLVGQVASPVRWDLCMETFREWGVTALVEVCPGGTLTGLAKRALRGVRTLPLKTPDDLDAARALVRECAAQAAAGSEAGAPGAMRGGAVSARAGTRPEGALPGTSGVVPRYTVGAGVGHATATDPTA